MGKRKKRNLKKTVAIIGEGITELKYFESLKKHENISNIKLKPELPKHPDINSIIKKANKSLQNGFDTVFCIIDLDRIFSNSTEEQNYYRFKKEYPKIEFIENNPCFEIWFLLHYEYSSREYNSCNQLISKLKKHIPDYEKTKKYFQNKDFYNFLKEKLSTAIKNSEKLSKNCTNSKNSSKCEIYKIINYLTSDN